MAKKGVKKGVFGPIFDPDPPEGGSRGSKRGGFGPPWTILSRGDKPPTLQIFKKTWPRGKFINFF